MPLRRGVGGLSKGAGGNLFDRPGFFDSAEIDELTVVTQLLLKAASETYGINIVKADTSGASQDYNLTIPALSSNAELVTTTATQTLTNKTISGLAVTQINDSNGNEALSVSTTSNAINEFTIANAATGGSPILSATGGDTNIGITLTPKGSGVVTITGNLNVTGTTTTIDSTTLTVDDKNIEMGSVGSPSDTTADGGGITLKGATDKTIIWDNANDNWTSNQDWNIASGKSFKINNAVTLNATTLGSAVVTSSLTTVGTLGSGAISSGFGAIDIGTSALSAGALTIDNITIDGNTISSSSGNITFNAASSLDFGDDSVLNVGTLTLDAIHGDNNAIQIGDNSDDAVSIYRVNALTATGDLDIGAHGFRSSTLTADGLTAGQVIYTGTSGLLSSESGFEYDSSANNLTINTISPTNINAFTLGGKLTAGSSEVEGSNFDINGGTVDAITALTIANNVDVGNYTIRANNFLADSHTATRVFFAGTDGVLTSDSDFTFATDTLTVTKIGAFTAVGSIDFDSEEMTNVNIDSGDIASGVTINKSPTITLTGDVTASATAMSNLGNVSISTTIGTLNQNTTGTAAIATTVTITDNESTDEDNALIFTAGGDVDGGNIGLESDGTLTYNPSTGKVTATGFVGTLTGNVTGTADVATVATTVTITDNENTNENNAIIFTAGGDVDGGNIGLESDGDLTYNPSTGLLSSTGVTASGTMTFGSLSDGTITATAFVDEDNMASDSATLIPTQQSVKAYVDANVASGAMSNFVLEDDDGTEVSITNAKEVKLIGSGVTTNWTDTDNGTDADPYDMTITVDAAQTGITSIHAAGLIMGEDAQTAIDFGTANEIDFKADNAARLTLNATTLYPVTDDQISLGTASLEFKDAFFDGTVTSDAFAGPLTGNVTGTADVATVATTVTITDNESTNEENAVVFTAGGDVDGGNLGLESDGNLTYNPSTGTLTATTFSGSISGSISDVTISENNSTDETVYPTFVDGATGAQGLESDTGFTYNPSSGLLTIAGELDAGSLDISGNADIAGALTGITNITLSGTLSDGNYTFDTSGNVSGLGTVASGNITSIGTVQGTTITATTAFVPDASDGAALGTTSLEFSDLYLADEAVIGFGDDQEVTLTHVHNAGLLLSSTDKLQFGDAGTFIHQSADGVLTIESDTTVDINGAVVFNGALTGITNITLSGTLSDGNYTFDTSGNVSGLGTVASGAITSSGVVTATGFTIGSAAITETELEILDGANVTTAELNIMDGGTSASSTTLADADRVVVNDAGTMKQVALTDFETYFESVLDTLSAVTTVGALNAGSITSGFTSIDVGSGAISSTGTVTTGALVVGGDISTAAAQDWDLVDNNASALSFDASGKSGILEIVTTNGSEKVAMSGDLTVAGNMTVTGTTTQVDTVTMNAQNAVIFEGATADNNETTLTIVDPTADHTVYMPNQTGYLPVLAAASTTQVSATPEEINLIDGGTARGTDAVASGDGILINDGGTMKMTNVDTVSTYFASHNVGGGNIVTTGALNSGSITSGFGTINTGSSAITTTGLISGGSLDIDNVLINGTTIGHTDDTDLMTLTDGVLTIAGEISVTTLDIGGTDVSSTAAELNLVDGSSANTVVNSKAVIYGGSGEVAGTLSTAAQGNVTSLGTLTALTVDNVAVNGTTIGHTSDTDLLTLTSANLAVAGDVEVSGSVEVATIDYTDGDNAVTIADGGGVTFAQDVSTTDAKYIKLGGSRMATAEPASDSTGYGIVIGFDSAGSISAGDAVYINSSGKVAQANANAGSVTDPAIGIATNAAGSDGDDCYVLTHGIWRLDAEAFQAGDPVYVGESAGALTKDIPNDDGDYVQRIGVAVSDDVIFVMPSLDVIEHA